MIQLSNNRIKYKIPHLRLPNSHFIPCWIPIFKRHLVVLQVPRGQEHPKETNWNYVQNGNWKQMKQHKNTCVIIYILDVYIYNYNYIYVMQRYTKYIWSFETLWLYLQKRFFLLVRQFPQRFRPGPFSSAGELCQLRESRWPSFQVGGWLSYFWENRWDNYNPKGISWEFSGI